MARLQTLLIFVLLSFGLMLNSCGSSKKATRTKTTTKYDARSKYASKLGVSTRDLENAALYNFIDQWEGVPYRYGGTTRSGVDCSGFVGALYKDVYRKSVPRTTSELERSSKKVSRNGLKEGDLVFFDIERKNSHVGVYLANDYFVHASTSRGVIISHLGNSYYKKVFSKGGRI